MNMKEHILAALREQFNRWEELLESLSEEQIAVWRGRSIGVIFQFFQLLPSLTVLENVVLPMDFGRKYSRGERRQRAMQLLEMVGVADQAHKLPSRLSGGQQQRAAIARALAPDPLLVLADEPTASLDHAHGGPLMDLMAELAAERGTTFLVASHDPAVIARAHRVFRLADGRLVEAP